MSKYQTYARKSRPPRRNEPHPIWRGIGCVIILFVPVLSYILSTIAVDYALKSGIQIPAGLLGSPVMPDWLFVVPGLVGFLNWIESQYNLYAYLLMALFFAVALGGVMSLVYAILYRIAGPPRYTELDAPPPSVKTKKYTR